MLEDRDEVEADQPEGGPAVTGVLQAEGLLLHAVAALRPGAEVVADLEALGVPGDGRAEPGVVGDPDGDGRTPVQVGTAVPVILPLRCERTALAFPGTDRADEDRAVLPRRAPGSHLDAGLAEGDALLAEADIRPPGMGRRCVGLERDHRARTVVDEIAIDGLGVVARVRDVGADAPPAGPVGEVLDEAIVDAQRRCEIGAVPRLQADRERQVVSLSAGGDLVEVVPEKPDLAVGVPAPLCVGVGVESGAGASLIEGMPADPLPLGRGSGPQHAAVPAEDERVHVAQEAPVAGLPDSDVDEDHGEALEQIHRVGQVPGTLELFDEALGRGQGLFPGRLLTLPRPPALSGRLLGAVRLPIQASGCLCPSPLCLAGTLDVLAGPADRPIVEMVQEVVEGPDTGTERHLLGIPPIPEHPVPVHLDACEDAQDSVAGQVVGPLVERGLADEDGEEQGPQLHHRVPGAPAPGILGPAPLQHRPGRLQVQGPQDQERVPVEVQRLLDARLRAATYDPLPDRVLVQLMSGGWHRLTSMLGFCIPGGSPSGDADASPSGSYACASCVRPREAGGGNADSQRSGRETRLSAGEWRFAQPHRNWGWRLPIGLWMSSRES